MCLITLHYDQHQIHITGGAVLGGFILQQMSPAGSGIGDVYVANNISIAQVCTKGEILYVKANHDLPSNFSIRFLGDYINSCRTGKEFPHMDDLINWQLIIFQVTHLTEAHLKDSS